MLWSAAVVLVVGLYQISAGTLQGMGKAMVPMYSLLLGAAIKIVITYTCTAMPAMGVRGAAFGQRGWVCGSGGQQYFSGIPPYWLELAQPALPYYKACYQCGSDGCFGIGQLLWAVCTVGQQWTGYAGFYRDWRLRLFCGAAGHWRRQSGNYSQTAESGE